MNQEERKKERLDKTKEKSTNLAWPTPGDSDVPPAEERANHIHTYSLMVAREQGLLSRGETTIVRTTPQSPRSSNAQQRVDDNDDQTDTVNWSDVMRLRETINDGLSRQDFPFLPAKSLRRFSSFNLLTAFVSAVTLLGTETELSRRCTLLLYCY